MTITEEINGLTWHNAINKLKSILRRLLPTEINYKIYTAILSQNDVDAPVATVLENTLGGDITWTRTSTGYYLGTLTGAFTAEKTAVILSPSDFTAGYETYRSSVNTVWIATQSTFLQTEVDGLLNGSTIQIKVYN